MYHFLFLFAISTLVRVAMGLSQFSGFSNTNPPQGHAAHGDFECHRTWLTVATHYPIEQWYTNTSLSNVSYWPMDYPPLCMQLHYVMGRSIEVLEPAAFETQGYKEPRYVFIMRLWVILLEYVIYVPAAVYFLRVTQGEVKPFNLMVITLIPATIFIDHGHFQFNQVMHGFVLWAIGFILDGKISRATIFMVLAINFKQMALYFALPFGVYALAILVERHKRDYVKVGGSIFWLLVVFVATNLLIWSPFIWAGG